MYISLLQGLLIYYCFVFVMHIRESHWCKREAVNSSALNRKQDAIWDTIIVVVREQCQQVCNLCFLSQPSVLTTRHTSPPLTNDGYVCVCVRSLLCGCVHVFGMCVACVCVFFTVCVCVQYMCVCFVQYVCVYSKCVFCTVYVCTECVCYLYLKNVSLNKI